jgi:hypothetical protein
MQSVPLQMQSQNPLKQPPNQRLQGNQWIKLSNSGVFGVWVGLSKGLALVKSVISCVNGYPPLKRNVMNTTILLDDVCIDHITQVAPTRVKGDGATGLTLRTIQK